MNYVKKILSSSNILNYLLVMYFFLGMQKNNSILQYMDYVLSIIIQVFYLYTLYIKKERLSKDKSILLTFNLLMIFIFFVSSLMCGSAIVDVLFRVIPLISIFGFMIITSDNKYYNLDFVLKYLFILYGILGVAILLDSLLFFVFDFSIWPPQYYLGYRFSGPFYDPNFFSITYSFFFILLVYKKNLIGSNSIWIALTYVLNIALGMSWSSIILLLLSFIISRICKTENMFYKQIAVFGTYFVFLFVFMIFRNQIHDLFIQIFSSLNLFTLDELNAKFLSLTMRIDTQVKALSLMPHHLLGNGPKSIVPMLGMDVHNSVVGYFFELGLPGLFLIMFSMPNTKVSYSKQVNVLSTFFFLISLTINMHYNVLYVLLMFLIYTENSSVLNSKVLNWFDQLTERWKLK